MLINLPFRACVLRIDEAPFTRSGVNSIHNLQEWALGDPLAIHRSSFELNISSRMVNTYLPGPCVIAYRLSEIDYSDLLEITFPFLVDDAPLNVRAGLGFQHRGVSPP